MEPGTRLGPYEILEQLGAGGMGEVYRARDSTLKRDVAIKVLPEDLADDPDRLARLEREAHLLAAMNHPNIATIHALQEHEGARFLVLELVKGESLEQLLARGPLPTEKALPLCKQIAAALEAAHSEGIVHRDLKPANVMVTPDGRAKLLDFGIAKSVDVGADISETTQGTNLTVAGTLIGTPAYMSPEQVRGEVIDKRSDNWAFGCLLYEALTGRSAFGRETLADTLAAVIDQDPDWEALSRAGGGRVESLIRRCLQKDPQQRLRDIGDAWVEIGESLAGDMVAVEPAPSPKRGKSLAAVALAVVLVAMGGIWWQTRPADESSQAVGGDPRTVAGVVSHPTVAVLPFQNLGGDDSLGYLSVAVPDEIISVLSRVETLAVRPFASTASYKSASVDLAEIGATVRAANLVTGQYFREGDQLSLTMEAVDVESNRLLWRESISVPAGDLLTLRQQVADKVNAGLVEVLAPAAAVVATATAPRSSEAYEMFLKSLALAREPTANRQAVEMLERAVELDPGYARIWAELSSRQYFYAHYGDGGAAAYTREEVAIRKALELDPEDVFAALRWTISLTEQSKVAEALAVADAMLEHHPGSPNAFFARSYARRYASLLDGAMEDCEMALALDPTNYLWRSCSFAFALSGDYERGAVFLALDPTSTFSREAFGHQLLSAGEPELAVDEWRDLPEGDAYAAEHDLAAAVVAGGEVSEIERALAEVVALGASERDPEATYLFAGPLVLAGAIEEAYAVVRRAIDGNYCAATALETERIWDPYRNDPDFREVQRLARECRDRLSVAND